MSKLGWEGERTHFDVLPLVLQVNEESPRYFEIPKHLVKEVAITHPELPEFEDLQLKWYAVPMISDMKLEIEGLSTSQHRLMDGTWGLKLVPEI